MLSKFKLFKEESGQVMVLFALSLVVLLGFCALAVDVGYMAVQKGSLQNAADSAALAGAMSIPELDDAGVIGKATEYADLNLKNTATVTPAVNRDEGTVSVEITQETPGFFAGLITSNIYSVTVRAKAKYSGKWEGEALPFINLDDDYSDNPQKIEAWENATPGDFESISNYEIVNPSDPAKLYFKVDYMNGITLKKGVVADKKQEIGVVYDQHYPDKPVYVISLNKDVINSGMVRLKDGTYRDLSELKDKDVVDLSQLVLLKCTFDSYDEKTNQLFLVALDVYDIANDVFPPDYISPDGGASILIE